MLGAACTLLIELKISEAPQTVYGPIHLIISDWFFGYYSVVTLCSNQKVVTDCRSHQRHTEISQLENRSDQVYIRQKDSSPWLDYTTTSNGSTKSHIALGSTIRVHQSNIKCHQT